MRNTFPHLMLEKCFPLMLLIKNLLKIFFLSSNECDLVVSSILQSNLKIKPRSSVPNLSPPIIVLKTLSHQLLAKIIQLVILTACGFISCFSTINSLRFNCHANYIKIRLPASRPLVPNSCPL